MSRRLFALAALSCSVLAVGACSSARFAGAPIRGAAAAPAMTPEPVEPMPSGPIETTPLPPVEGQPLPPVGGAPAAGTPGGPMTGPGGQNIAALPPASAPAPVAPAPAPSSRTSMVGGWTAQVASGGSCKIQLSSAPALDLYRASAAGCSNQELSKVNAWDYRDGEVYLYQTGGSVAARLRGASGSLSGALTKSGAPLTLRR